MQFVGVACVVTSASAFSASHHSTHHLPHHHHRKHHVHAAKAKHDMNVLVKNQGLMQSSSAVKGKDDVTTFCSDTPVGWTSKTGWTCDNYAGGQYCTEDGSPGQGWSKDWGSLKDWANDAGQSAVDACCACGGGMEVEIHRSALGDSCEEGEAISTERDCRQAARLIGAGYAMTAHWPVGQPSGCHVDADGKTVWLNTSPEGSSPHPNYASLCASDGKHRHSSNEGDEDGDDDDDDDEEEDEEQKKGAYQEAAKLDSDQERDTLSTDEHQQEPRASDDLDTARLRKAVVASHAALADNMKRRVEIGIELHKLTTASSTTDIDSRVEALAGETKSPELARFLGDMWQEQRHFEIPVYKEHLQSEYAQLESEAVSLQAAYDFAKHELEAKEGTD